MPDLLLLEGTTDGLLLEGTTDSLLLEAALDSPVFVWFIEIPITGTDVRTIDKSQLLFGASLELQGSLEMDYFRRYLNDVDGIDI